MRTAFPLFLALTLLPAALPAQKKKNKSEKEVTQTLEATPDLPAAVTVETARIEYLVSPLSAKGLLSQQVRDGLKSLRTQASGRSIVKIRAFVAGTGDQRRVPAIIAETFADKKQPLPALATIQVGQLPQEGAQVILEATVTAKKPVNPHGLGFLSGMGGMGDGPTEKVLPMLDKAIADLSHAAKAAGSEPADVIRVTCLLSGLDEINEVRTRVSAAFPAAVLTAVQAQRLHDKALAECEAVVRLRKRPSEGLAMLNPPEMNPSPMYSKGALIGSEKLVLTGAQLAFHQDEKDVHLAFQRIAKALESANSSMKLVAFSSLYSLSNPITAKIRAARFDYYDKAKPPASTLLLFEGLPSMDASFAIELVAVPR
ncbi:MAG TPA: RidA family protein [Bryobacteraceae bacterium]|nr:RidA family protein [Bryobacteraceae bacterium]